MAETTDGRSTHRARRVHQSAAWLQSSNGSVHEFPLICRCFLQVVWGHASEAEARADPERGARGVENDAVIELGLMAIIVVGSSSSLSICPGRQGLSGVCDYCCDVCQPKVCRLLLDLGDFVSSPIDCGHGTCQSVRADRT